MYCRHWLLPKAGANPRSVPGDMLKTAEKVVIGRVGADRELISGNAWGSELSGAIGCEPTSDLTRKVREVLDAGEIRRT